MIMTTKKTWKQTTNKWAQTKDEWNQVNLRFKPDQLKVLKDCWKDYCKKKEKVSFNSYLLSFFNAPTKTSDPLYPLVPLGTVFEDDRGDITNILNREITATALIFSHANTVRSNHYHKRDWHYLYVVYGKMEYWERSLDGNYTRSFIVNEGQMVFTKPGLVHKTVFLENTLLLSLGNYVDHDQDTFAEDF